MSKRKLLTQVEGGDRVQIEGDRPLERIEHFDPEREHVAFKGRDKAQWNRWGCICCCVCPCVCVGMGILVSYLTAYWYV